MENIFRNGHFIKKYRGEKAIASVMEIPAEPVKSLFSQILDGTVESISEADFDENLTQIAPGRFCYFPNIKSLTIPNNIQKLGDYFCYECPSLQNLTLGTGITSIGGNFIYPSYNLKSITIYAETPPTLANFRAFPSGLQSLDAIYVPASSVDAYKTAETWKEVAGIIQAIV